MLRCRSRGRGRALPFCWHSGDIVERHARAAGTIRQTATLGPPNGLVKLTAYRHKPSLHASSQCLNGDGRVPGQHIPPWVRRMRVLSAPPSWRRHRRSGMSFASPPRGRSSRTERLEPLADPAHGEHKDAGQNQDRRDRRRDRHLDRSPLRRHACWIAMVVRFANTPDQSPTPIDDWCCAHVPVLHGPRLCCEIDRPHPAPLA